jgi:hypothetical protein
LHCLDRLCIGRAEGINSISVNSQVASVSMSQSKNDSMSSVCFYLASSALVKTESLSTQLVATRFGVTENVRARGVNIALCATINAPQPVQEAAAASLVSAHINASVGSDAFVGFLRQETDQAFTSLPPGTALAEAALVSVFGVSVIKECEGLTKGSHAINKRIQ